MTRLLLAFLVFSLCCYSSNAQLLDEGSTTTTVIESQGNVEEVTETTVTIEHKTTGDVLDSDNGIVATSKDGNANIDWGGAGAIYSHSSCTDAASGFPATGTDGRTSGCGHARYTSLTTWRQYVDLNSFDINEGGEVNYEFLFAFPDSMYQNAGQTAYVQTKGYNDNVLQWETGLVPIDKTTFTQNPYNYTGNTNWVNTVTGSHDFANQLDKVYIEIGGYGEYYWDEFQYTVAYNHITTVVDTWMQVVQQQELDTTINTLIDDPITTSPSPTQPPVEIVDVVDVIDVSIDPPGDSLTGGVTPDVTTTNVITGSTIDDVATEVETLVAEIEEIDSTTTTDTAQTTSAIDTPTEQPTSNQEPQEADTEGVAQNDTETETETQQAEAKPEPVEEKQETSEETQQEEGEEKQVAEEQKEEKQVEEVAEEQQEEKQEVAENDAEEKEPVQKDVKQEKQSKQEQKQAKAKEILNNFTDPYSNVAQMTTLALVNALGPNMKTYEAPVQAQPTWYESEEIYADVILPSPLNDYFGVRDSLTFNKMIDMQYE